MCNERERDIYSEARNTSDLDLLNELCTRTNDRIREAVASNKNIDEGIMMYLANDFSHYVRMSLAKNETLTYRVSSVLANDESLAVRMALAMNKHLVSCIYLKLSLDDIRVREQLFKNDNVPREVLWSALVSETKDSKLDEFTHICVLRSPNVTSEMLEYAAKDKSPNVVKEVMEHSMTPEHIKRTK